MVLVEVDGAGGPAALLQSLNYYSTKLRVI